MGCVNPRSDITAEEATSHNFDLLLGYTHINVSNYFIVHQKWTSEKKLSVEDFEKLKQELRLYPKNPDNTQQVINFYEQFKVDLTNYNSQKTLILAVILCSGSQQEKAQVLFKGFWALGARAKAEEVKEMFLEVFESCLKVLTGLQVRDEVNGLTAEDLRKFSGKLRNGMEEAAEKLTVRVMGQDLDVDEENFVTRVKDRLPGCFFTGDSIRKLLKKYGKKHI